MDSQKALARPLDLDGDATAHPHRLAHPVPVRHETDRPERIGPTLV